MQGLLDAVPARALVQLGQLGAEGGQPRRQVVGAQPRLAGGVQRLAGGEERLAGPLDGGGQPGQLRLGLVEQGGQAALEPVQLLAHPHQIVLGTGQLRPGLRGDGRLQVVAVQVVGVDRLDVEVADLVDALPQRDELLLGPAGGGRGVDRADGLYGDPEIALGRVQLVEGGGRRVLGGLGVGPLALAAPAEPAPGAPAGERGGHRRQQQGEGEQCQGEGVPQRGAPAGPVPRRGPAACRCVRLRRCRRHPSPVLVPPCPASFSHRLMTNTGAGKFAHGAAGSPLRALACARAPGTARSGGVSRPAAR